MKFEIFVLQTWFKGCNVCDGCIRRQVRFYGIGCRWYSPSLSNDPKSTATHCKFCGDIWQVLFGMECVFCSKIPCRNVPICIKLTMIMG